MKPNFFMRFSGFLVLLTFTYSCSNHYTVVTKSESFDPLNSGDGTPVYAYIDNDGNASDIDYGITVFTVENNKQAKGGFIYSKDTEDDYNSVTFSYKDITVTMFFNDDSNFPTSMIAYDSTETANGYFTLYDDKTQTYNIFIEQENSYSKLSNIFLDKELLSKYEYNSELTPSQNKRIHNLTVASAVYFSLYNFYESETSSDTSSARGTKLSNWFKKIFKVVAIIVIIVVVIILPPAIILVQILPPITPVTPKPTPQEPKSTPSAPITPPSYDDRIFIKLTWDGDRKGGIEKPEDFLHFLGTEYTIGVEISLGDWNEEKLNNLIKSDYYAYSPQASLINGEHNKRPSALAYFKEDYLNDIPYEITNVSSDFKKFDIKFKRRTVTEEAELRIGLHFDNPLFIEDVDNEDFTEVNVKFYGNIDNDPGYISKNHSKEEDTYPNILTTRFCLYSEYVKCPHFD